MIDEILNNAKMMYNLKNLVRYNHTAKIKDENVLEHSAIVSMIVFDLGHYYKFDVDKAVKMALVHDISEQFTTDICHDVKQNFPKIKEAVKQAEIDCISNFSSNISEMLLALQEKTVETKIVEFADIISCSLYAQSEVILGNSGKIKKILNETNERIIEITNELEEYKK
jgi:5'-deoxynucleotidase YfbR-like HD superfamily hydrolase